MQYVDLQVNSMLNYSRVLKFFFILSPSILSLPREQFFMQVMLFLLKPF